MSIVQSSEEKKKLFLQEYTKRYIHLVPEYLRDNDSFLVFFALLCNEFNITTDNIRSFTDLINPDKVPLKFLEALGQYFNYHYQERAPESFNRELLMRNRLLYEDRGTPHSIIMAASHGDNEGYLGGDIFIPGYEISKELAELTIGRDRIFIHSKSKLSSTSVYSDHDRFRPGVLILSLSYLDEDIRNKLWEVIPAGIRLRYTIISDMKPNDQDPEDLYNFIPDIGAAKSRERTLTWYPYFRVAPIFSHGDVNTSGSDFYNPFRNNYPQGLDILIEMAINRGLLRDILIHSDNTLNRKDLFDENGILIGDYNDVRLAHGRRLHSGTQQLDEYIQYIDDIGVSALPLSFVRRPFELSSIPENAPYTEVNETVVIQEGGVVTHEVIKITEEHESFKFSSVSSFSGGSRHSGGSNVTLHNEDGTETEITTTGDGQVFSGTYEEIEKEYEQEYVEPEEQVIPKRYYRYYRITPTGEYEDRIDKLTTDSVMRGFNTTLDLEKGYPYKYHNMRTHSSPLGIHSGTVQNRSYWRTVKSVLRDGVSYGDIDLIGWTERLVNHYARDRLSELVDNILDKIYNNGINDILYYVQIIQNSEENIISLQKAYEDARSGSIEKEILGKQIEGERRRVSNFLDSLNSIREEIEGTLVFDYDDSGRLVGSHREGGFVNEIIEILEAEVQERDPIRKKELEDWNRELKNLFNHHLKYYQINNPIFSGIFIPGDVNEYVPIQTMQPSDTHYPISEVLDVKADYNRPWDRIRLEESEDDEETFGLNQYGENRDPFFQNRVESSRDYEPHTEGSDYIDCNIKVFNLTNDMLMWSNIVKDGIAGSFIRSSIISGFSGGGFKVTRPYEYSEDGKLDLEVTIGNSSYRSGKHILEMVHDREDGRGTVHVDKDKIIHSGRTLFSGLLTSNLDREVPEVAKLSGLAVYGGLSKEVLDRKYITEMYSDADHGSGKYIESYLFTNIPDFVDSDVEQEEYGGQGSIFSIIHSSMRGQFSGASIFDGKQGVYRRTSPEFSFTHSAYEDGMHSGRASFSGKSNWMNEQIIDATYFEYISDDSKVLSSDITKVISDSHVIDVELEFNKLPHRAIIFSSKTSIIGMRAGMMHSGKLEDDTYYKVPSPYSIIHSKFSKFSGSHTFEGSEMFPDEPIVVAGSKVHEIENDILNTSNAIYDMGSIDIEVEEYKVPWQSMIFSSPDHIHSSYKMFSGEWIYKSEPIIDASMLGIGKDIEENISSNIVNAEYRLVGLDVEEKIVPGRALVFSSKFSKIGNRIGMYHSGKIIDDEPYREPDPDSIIHSKDAYFSGKKCFSGAIMWEDEPYIKLNDKEPYTDYTNEKSIEAGYEFGSVDVDVDWFKVPKDSVIHSKDGNYSSYKMFSGEWIYKTETIIKADYLNANYDNLVDGETNIIDETHSSIDVEVNQSYVPGKALVFSTRTSRFGTRTGMYRSGKIIDDIPYKRPTADSIIHSKSNFSGENIYSGSKLWQEETIVKINKVEPAIDYQVEETYSSIYRDGDINLDIELFRLPKESIIHSKDGNYSSYKMFSGEGVYTLEKIVDASYSIIDKDISKELSSDIVNVDLNVIGVELEKSTVPHKAMIFNSETSHFGNRQGMRHSGTVLDDSFYRDPDHDSIVHSKDAIFSGNRFFSGDTMFEDQPYVKVTQEVHDIGLCLDNSESVKVEYGSAYLDVEWFKAPKDSMIHSSDKSEFSSYKMHSGEWVYKSEPIISKDSDEPSVDKEIDYDLEKVSSENINSYIDVIQNSYNEKSINFSTKDALLSTNRALHSGDREKPSKSSIILSDSNSILNKAKHDGKLFNT